MKRISSSDEHSLDHEVMNNAFWTSWRLRRTMKTKLEDWIKFKGNCEEDVGVGRRRQVKSVSVGSIPCCVWCINSNIFSGTEFEKGTRAPTKTPT